MRSLCYRLKLEMASNLTDDALWPLALKVPHSNFKKGGISKFFFLFFTLRGHSQTT